MHITNCGRGVHKRELAGIDKLKGLPPNWRAYTNLDVILGPGRPREIDVIIVADDRVFLVDLKDWRGKIENSGGNWTHKKRDHGASPVGKISAIARDLSFLLSAHINKHSKGVKVGTPLVQGIVIITGGGDFSGVTGTEAASVFEVGDFIKRASDAAERVRVFGKSFTPANESLTSGAWKHLLGGFFNVDSGGALRRGVRRYGNYVVDSEASTFEHPAQIFSEYNVVDEHAQKTAGMLRLWDFTRAETRFQNEEGRAEIAGREREVVGFIADRSEVCAQRLLTPLADDPERGVSYWEVYERRQRLKRLKEFAVSSAAEAGETRVELARQLISAVADLHGIDAAHFDLAAHSVWLEAPTTVRLSHLMAARLPQVRSLGAARYQFLSSARAPEDSGGGQADPLRRDVYLLGACVYEILFRKEPTQSAEGICVWEPLSDAKDEFSRLHEWLEIALAHEPARRFASARDALASFNKATEPHPTRQEVIEGLETFRQGSQKRLFADYPETEPLRESDRLDVWRSAKDGDPVLVKMWKAPAWGDTTREGPRLLAFLELARDLKLSPQAGCVRIRDVSWLGDAIALVSDWAPGCDLAHSLHEEPRWGDKNIASQFLLELIDIVQGLHERGRAHGDIKPHNIIVASEDGLRPTLIDLLDFSASQDGEIVSNAYAPLVGGRQERDRFAVTRIAEDVLAALDFDAQTMARLAQAIRECREKEPRNGTLLPLSEALQDLGKESVKVKSLRVEFSARNAATGEVVADEGFYFIRRGDHDQEFILRGAFEEIRMGLDAKGEALYAERRGVDQKRIGLVVRAEFFSFTGSVHVRDGAINELIPLRAIFQDSEFLSALSNEASAHRSDGGLEEDGGSIDEPDSDLTEDRLAEEIAEELSTQRATPAIDVKRLWRALMDTESAMTNEVVALDDSYYDKRLKRHVVPIKRVRGVFDFDRKEGDRVVVKREGRDSWSRIGELDLRRLDPEQAYIEGDHWRETIVRRNQRLIFVSHREYHSRTRRQEAIDRVLSRRGRIADLADVFANSNWPPEIMTSRWTGADFAQYGLNEAQVTALESVLKMRPLGLVQGPPGTGKTVFIAALIHFVLTRGVARNVLLASQSHEAVNNAAEAVLKLYRRDTQAPSMLRVGDESVVSDSLAQFHSQRVEQAMKDRFRAEIRERLNLVAGVLGVPGELAEELIYLEMTVRPLVERLSALGFSAEPERRTGLTASLTNALQRVRLEHVVEGFGQTGTTAEKMHEMSDLLRRRAAGGASADTVARFRQVAQLAVDFIGSSSGGMRNFEPLLAGTRQIVVGTCVGLGRQALGLTKTAFDLVIVDEAARCTAGELAVPMQAGRWVVLVGDHAQLEPQHPRTVVAQVARDTRIAKAEVARSDFERTFSGMYGKAVGQTLTTQYRMLPPIGRVVSSAFYNNSLDHGRVEPHIPVDVLPRHLEKTIAWLPTDELGKQAFQRADDASLYNPAEAALIVALLEAWQKHDPFVDWLERQRDHAHAIGVICTYASQRDKLSRRLDGSHLKPALRASIKVDTVDAYQGKENPIVLLSLVRNNLDGHAEGARKCIREGFLSRPHRINVAMSRAMDRLVIVGAHSRWRTGGPMEEVTRAFQAERDRGEAQIIRPQDVLPDHDGGGRPKKRVRQ